MGKYSKILFVLTLALALFLAQASALDIWGGSNSMIASPGATVEGGLDIGTDSNELNYDLFAYSLVPAGSTGFAYSDWNIPAIQTATGSYTVDSINHEFTVLYQGHVQTGVQKDSSGPVDGDSYAESHVTAIAGVNPTEAKDVYGSGDINSELWLSGKSSGYAIADGLAGYSSAAKVTGTNNDFTKVEGAAVGTASLNGAGGVYARTPILGTRYTHNHGEAYISSEGYMFPGLYPLVAGTHSEIGSWGHIGYDGFGIPSGTRDGATSLDWYATGSANAMAWDSGSPVVKTEANANALTDITDASIVGGVGTFKFMDEADSEAHIGTDAFGWGWEADADIYTDANVYRAQTNTANKVSAESYINGGTYKAVWKPTVGKEYSVSGTIGWDGYLPGMASGAHLVNTLPYTVGSYSNLYQEANEGNTIGTTRTTADYTSYTTGPQFTNNILDDAGSYFGTTGYTTTSKELDTYSTSVASYYDVNWINGKQVSTPRYDSFVTWTESPAYSAIYDVWSWGGVNGDGSRFNDVGKELEQTIGT